MDDQVKPEAYAIRPEIGASLLVRADPVDLRDQRYVPRLFEYPLAIIPDMMQITVRDQIVDGPCTGYALAAVIDMQNQVRRTGLERSIAARRAFLAGIGHDGADTVLAAQEAALGHIPPVCSARMLYEMARSHDEFVETIASGDIAQGSSIRGAIKGFYHNGVAREDALADAPGNALWAAGIARHKEARNVMLGAYFRIAPQLNHYHSAIAEVGAILVSARIHDGWVQPKDAAGRPGRIAWTPAAKRIGGHAFAIVGYDDNGFIILNSWGERWGGFDGEPGLAHWSYDDWAANVMDAWVLRLGVPTPAAFDYSIGEHGLTRAQATKEAGAPVRSLPRSNVVGHYANIDDGVFSTEGSYPSDLESIAATAAHVAANKEGKYEGLVLYAHGGLNSINDAITRVGALKDGFKRNGLYPFFFCWNTGIVGEARDILSRIFQETEKRSGAGLRSAFDGTLEKLARVPGRALWREMKTGARRAFDPAIVRANLGLAANARLDPVYEPAGLQAVETFCAALDAAKSEMPIHLIGHSAGAIFLGEMLNHVSQRGRARIASVSLLAPACTCDFFAANWLPTARRLTAKASDRFALYNLSAEHEKTDTVGPYGKSLLYFVSNAFEERPDPTRDTPMPIAGMEISRAHLTALSGGTLPFDIHLSSEKSKATRSKTHGGFDADPVTMNHVLTRLTGKPAARLKGFQPHEIAGI